MQRLLREFDRRLGLIKIETTFELGQHVKQRAGSEEESKLGGVSVRAIAEASPVLAAIRLG
ncbi:hypothetical protein N9D23_10820 [Rubripirellula sp.]|nr:hypothetical protein [Rubripirellula sp.]